MTGIIIHISEAEGRIWTPRVMQEFEKACWQVHVYSVSLWGATPNLYGFIHVARILYELKVYQHRQWYGLPTLLTLSATVIASTKKEPIPLRAIRDLFTASLSLKDASESLLTDTANMHSTTR